MNMMLQGVTKIIEYRSKLPQPLRNVSNRQPSLIRVIQGTKQLMRQDDIVNIRTGQLIMLPAGQPISFINQPIMVFIGHGKCSYLAVAVMPFISGGVDDFVNTRRCGQSCGGKIGIHSYRWV